MKSKSSGRGFVTAWSPTYSHTSIFTLGYPVGRVARTRITIPPCFVMPAKKTLTCPLVNQFISLILYLYLT